MDSNDISNVLNTFAQWPRSFSIEEISNFLEDPVDREELHHILLNDSRFVCITQDSQERYYISQKTLLRWFCNLNVRLSQIRKFKLNNYQLALAMSCLRRDGRWNTFPKSAVEFGQKFGLINYAWTSHYYVFPVAWVLSFWYTLLSEALKKGLIAETEYSFWLHSFSFSQMSSLIERIACSIASELDSLQHIHKTLDSLLSNVIDDALCQLTDREKEILKLRLGLADGYPHSIKFVARTFHITRERVCQIVIKTLEKLKRKLKLFELLHPVLYDVMKKQGSLVYKVNQSFEPSFIISLSNLILTPQQDDVLQILSIINSCQDDVSQIIKKELRVSNWFPDKLQLEAIASYLETRIPIPLTFTDVKDLAQALLKLLRGQLNTRQRAYLALRAIGRPAHYSEITKVHNFLFPERATNEKNIHAALNREQHGVVWIGIRGTFALKEWGYERPSKSLYEAVAEIVQEKFNQTGKPVPFTVIAAEIGKYRKIVKPSSLVFATHCNPKLQRVSKDSFIPKSTSDQDHEEITLDELDKILKEFEQSKGSIKSEC